MAWEGAVSSYALRHMADRASGYVHSVFSTSLNILLDGFLLHVGGTAGPLSCLGIAVPEPELRELLGKAKAGDLAFLSKGTLKVYSRAGVTDISYGDFETVPCELGEPIDGELLATLVEPLEELGLDARIGLEMDERLRAVLRTLAEKAPDPPELEAAIRFLLGRGKGLTPSGDDLLVGYGVAQWLRGRQKPFTDALTSVLGSQTTDVSLAYLRAMVAGVANPDCCELANAVRGGEQIGRAHV